MPTQRPFFSKPLSSSEKTLVEKPLPRQAMMDNIKRLELDAPAVIGRIRLNKNGGRLAPGAHIRHVTRIEPDARSHRAGDDNFLNILSLGRRRLGAYDRFQHGV